MSERDNERVVEIADVSVHDQDKQAAIEILRKTEGPFVLISGNRKAELGVLVSANLKGDRLIVAAFIMGIVHHLRKEAYRLEAAALASFFGEVIDIHEDDGNKDLYDPSA